MARLFEQAAELDPSNDFPRQELARAREAMKENTADPVRAQKKFEKIKAKYDRKIERLQPKVKELTLRRAELKERHTAKG